MAKIPTINSQVSAKSGRAAGVFDRTSANPDDFGAGIGRAMQQLAQGVDQLGAGLAADADRKRNEDVANRVAMTDFTSRELDVRNNTAVDGAGYQDTVLSEYDAYVDEEANKIDDDLARQDFKNRMNASRKGLSSRSATYEATLAATASKEAANASITSLQNKLITDPNQYLDYVEQGIDVIDARPNLAPNIKAAMKADWMQNAARTRFMGMLETATSAADVDALAAELTNGTQFDEDSKVDWTEELTTANYETLMNKLGTAKKAIATKADADARAALDTISERNGDVNEILSEQELAQVGGLVSSSSNPATVEKFERIKRDNQLKQDALSKTPAQVREDARHAEGNAGVAYPGVPPELSAAVNDASDTFGVSGSYLGMTMNKEYGQYLTSKPRTGNVKFAPVVAGKHVNLSNVRNEVIDAATIAGEVVGFPLSITSGHRTQAHQDGIRAKGDPNRVTVAKKSHHTSGTGLDISTAGMSQAEQAAVVDALAGAGFTGFGQYGNHIHADFRDAIPDSYGDKDGKQWGGWTHLSPEITEVLTARGFAAGGKSSSIKRDEAVTFDSDIDYTQGTSIKDANGNPTSSATGLFQFTEGTFLGIVKDGRTAAMLGIDVSGMSDAQILEMRKDPELSIKFGAALAAQNKNTLEKGLGRTVNDAELYMAHFLGAKGATTLVGAYGNNPNMSAADLMPSAAQSNKPVFYHKNGEAKSVAEVYDGITADVATSPNRVTYGDNQTRRKIANNMDEQLASDPVAFAMNTGKYNISDVSTPDGIAARGAEALSIANMYDIPEADMKPFTEDEAASIGKTLREANIEDQLEIAVAIGSMGDKMARAALNQLGEDDSVFAHAAGLQNERGQKTVSAEILRGRKHLADNPAVLDTVGASKTDISDAFLQATGGSLVGASPKERQTIQDAAFAHYIGQATRQGNIRGFDAKAYAASVQAVLGGTQGSPAVAEVNGQPTVLPKGVTGNEMNRAVNRMTLEDWTVMSDDLMPPMYSDGTVAHPRDLADEARLIAVGGDEYHVVLDDGSYLIGENFAPYTFKPEPERIKKIAARPVEIPVIDMPVVERNELVNDDGWLTLEEQDALRKSFGVLHQFDDDGRWIGPPEGN